MINLFSKNNSIAIIIIPVLVLGHLLLGSYYSTFEFENIAQENLWELNFYVLQPIISKFLAFIFICANAILLNFIFNKLEFNDRFIYLPSIFYILIIFLFPFSLYFNEYLIVHFFFILSFYQLLSINQNEDARNNVFLSGLYLGVATTFSPPSAMFLAIIWISIFSIRPFSLREHLLPFIGFATLFLWIPLVNERWWSDLFSFVTDEKLMNNNQLVFIAYLLILILTLLGMKKMLERRFQSSIIFKRISSVTLFSFTAFFALGLLMAIVHHTFSYFVFCAILLPFILPYAYINVKYKWIPNIIFYLLISLNIFKFFFS